MRSLKSDSSRFIEAKFSKSEESCGTTVGTGVEEVLTMFSLTAQLTQPFSQT